MMKEIGSTQSAAIAIRQSKKNNPMATIVVEIQAPTSSGTKRRCRFHLGTVRHDRTRKIGQIFFPEKGKRDLS